MKALLTTILLLATVVGTVGAQTNVRLNIVLNHVQNLTVHPEQNAVTLTYNDLEDYRRGVEVVKNSHLTVFSTGAYEVKVKLANEEFVKLGGQPTDRLLMPHIKIKARPVAAGQKVSLTTGELSTVGGRIISSAGPAFDVAYDVTYQGPGGEELIRYAEQNKSVVFTNDVLYSIETR
ncbi:hypothetical protein [Sphingobacterium paucimobilis]|uniref:Uncharacterized protein n=1 Tax=Sphingobacterium paucimobilis HER1398 TaxID=1346330 RepID=U2I1K7_9SPHI|nr:hypothetical protein [Sphingobacterium paucimobilis]ERJ61405.1 hypothetical protein M472_21855 [Sphingobacterium paucimobilis HER1398]